MASKVLVPLDGSELSEAALPWAACLARARGCSVVLARANPWPVLASDGIMGGYISPEVYEELIDTEREVSTDYLNEVRARQVLQGLNVEIAVRPGSPVTALLDLSDEQGAEAIVMATHGRGGLPRVVLGSVANYVVQHATLPMLLVRAHGTGSVRPPAFDRMLVALDGSALAEGALDYATEIAQTGSTAVLVRVEDYDEQRSDASHPTRSDLQDLASTYLESVSETVPSQGLHIETDVRFGRPAEQVLEAARAHEADIIVMATHGRSGPSRWLLGSVADEVMRHADRPVLLVSARALVGRSSEPTTIGDLLTTAPVTVRDDESLDVVLRKLLRQRITGFGVVNARGDLVGLVSEREMTDWHDKTISELASQEAVDPGAYAQRLQAATVASIMTHPTPALDASTPLGRATHVFRERRVARLPVTRDGKLIGILTRTDILKAMAARLHLATGVENPSD